MLPQEHAAEFGEPVRRVVECAEDPLSIVDRQRKNDRLPLESVPDPRMENRVFGEVPS